jgi:hypothetical protein
VSATNLGKVTRDVAEAFAWLMSPSAIDAQIRELRDALGGGDTSPATTALLADWQTIRATQARLVGGTAQEGEADGTAG